MNDEIKSTDAPKDYEVLTAPVKGTLKKDWTDKYFGWWKDLVVRIRTLSNSIVFPVPFPVKVVLTIAVVGIVIQGIVSLF